MKYIDIHAHLNFSDFDKDREKVIERTIDNEMGVINIGTSLETSTEVVLLADEYKDFYAAVGIHPTESQEVDNIENVINELKVLAENSKVVCIGECGLDYFHIEKNVKEYKEQQKVVFEKQIEMALELDLPLMIHCRDAYGDLIEILKKYKHNTEDENEDFFGKNLRGNVHFFAGDVNDAKALLSLGFTISFTGVITFAPQYRELVEFVPIEKMHAETDSPFVAPNPNRGKRNEPLNTLEVIKKIAEIKKLDFNEVSKQFLENSKKLFGIDF